MVRIRYENCEYGNILQRFCEAILFITDIKDEGHDG